MSDRAKEHRADWGGEKDGARYSSFAWPSAGEETGIPAVERAIHKPVVGILDEKAGGIIGYIIADCEPAELIELANKGFDIEEGV